MSTRGPIRRSLLVVLLTLVVVAVSYLAFGWIRFYHQYREYNAETPEINVPVVPDEAIVVLTGDQRRIPKAIQLLRHRGSPLLIISGTGRGTTLTDLVNQQGAAAVNIHEVWRKIVLEPKSTSTIENAEETGKLVRRRQVHRIILVTSDYHMPRSLLVFRRLIPGVEILPYPVSSNTPLAGEGHTQFENDWRVWIEYLKYFVFEHFVISQLDPTSVS